MPTSPTNLSLFSPGDAVLEGLEIPMSIANLVNTFSTSAAYYMLAKELFWIGVPCLLVVLAVRVVTVRSE
jgi:hypothetical protein